MFIHPMLRVSLAVLMILMGALHFAKPKPFAGPLDESAERETILGTLAAAH